MRKTYGNTWWGAKWLEALNGIDYDNRLPRGRTYANKGAVRDISLESRPITAKVQGSRPRPYKQEVSLKPFTKLEKSQLIKAVTENPVILSALLSRELPKELFDLCQDIGIRLFPTNWRDISAECSCPDWALPCKHLAAVIYLIANEIDKNPFLFFKLKGLDLLAALEEKGLGSQEATELPIKKLYDGWGRKKFAAPAAAPVQIGSKLDFSKLPQSASETLLQLLPDSALFYQGDFKASLKKMYSKVAKRAKKSWSEQQEQRLPFDLQVQVVLDEDGRLLALNDQQGRPLDTFKEFTESLWKLAQQIHLEDLGHYHPSVGALFWAKNLATHLAERGAFIPELLELKPGHYIIRWIPALLLEPVCKLFEEVASIIPPEMVALIKSDTTSKPKLAKTPEAALKALIANFVWHWVYYERFWQEYGDQEQEAYQAFYGTELLHTSGFAQKENAQAVQRWLQKFYLSERRFAPILRIDEADGLGFDLSFWVQDNRQKLEAPRSVRDIFTLKKFVKEKPQVMQDLLLLSEYFPPLRQYLQEQAAHSIYLDGESLAEVILHVLPALGALGVQTLLPKSLRQLARPQLGMRMEAKGSSGSSGEFVNFTNLLQYDWTICIGNQTLTPGEFKKLVRKMKGVVELNGEYVLIDDQELESILKKLDNPPKMTEKSVAQAVFSEDYDGARIILSEKARQLRDQILHVEETPVPKGLKATLRPYQKRGYEWMYKNTKTGFGSLLADDMGLGKTLQVIALLLKAKEEGGGKQIKALVVVPTTLLGNWEREIGKFAPALTMSIFHGPQRRLQATAQDVLLTSYGVARSDNRLLSKQQWDFLVIDEAQNIKNTGTAQAKAIKKLKASVKIAMSGTPVENRLSEYWSIFDFTNKGYLDSLAKFKKRFIVPIEKDRDQASLERFRKVTAPFILRRLKSDKSIISDLPDKSEADRFCHLSKEQAALYQNVVNKSLRVIQGEDETIARSGLIFQMMNALKQICNHPAHFLKKKSLAPEQSGKTSHLLEILDNIWESDEKVLMFTQYKEMGDLLAKLLADRYGLPPLWLHGGTTRKKRDQMVEDFQNQHHLKFMLLSLKAGGTGLNLTAANHVVHYDLWWNPAVENQATDRAYRIGQTKKVMVHRLITQNTFEEKINAMIQSKKELADLTVATGETWVTKMNNDELRDLFQMEQ